MPVDKQFFLIVLDKSVSMQYLIHPKKFAVLENLIESMGSKITEKNYVWNKDWVSQIIPTSFV